MKTIIFTLSLSLTAFFMTAQTPTDSAIATSTTVTVTVPVKNSEGTVIIALQDQATFMKGGIQNMEGEIVDGKATVTFKNVSPGTYAVLLFHDKNSNKQMDFQANGMPIEPYGVSNNVMNFGPPQWNDAKFEVAATPVQLEIMM